MQSPGQFADWAFEKVRTALWDGLDREVSTGREAACEAVTKAVFYTRLGYAVTKCEIKDADFQAVWIFEGVHLRCCGHGRLGGRPRSGPAPWARRHRPSMPGCLLPAWLLGAFVCDVPG
ncbi:hypothetical protein D3C84_580390 [compost metagenome]